MSDEPPSYFLNGVELLGFRRKPDYGLFAPGEVLELNKFKSRGKKASASKRAQLYLRDGNNCHYCKVVMDKPSRSPNSVSADHVVPRASGGVNSLYNLVLACEKCNNGYGSQYIKCHCDFCKRARYLHESI